MPMDLKRDQRRRPSRFKNFLAISFKKILFIAIFACLFGLVGWAAYMYIYPVRETVDHLLARIEPMASKYGWLSVIGVGMLILGAIWAVVDEQSQKDSKRRQ